MVALHTIEQHLQFVARFGNDYTTAIEAAIAKRTDTHVYLHGDHPAFVRWHGTTPIGKPPAPAAQTVHRAPSSRRQWQFPQPGALLAKFISWLGFESNDGCGCSSYAAAMDTLGWRGCWRRRDAITTRLIDQARKQSLRIVGVHGLIAAAVRLSYRRLLQRQQSTRLTSRLHNRCRHVEMSHLVPTNGD